GSVRCFAAHAPRLAGALNEPLAKGVDLMKISPHSFEHNLPVDVDHVTMPDFVTIDNRRHLSTRGQLAGLALRSKDRDLRHREILQDRFWHELQRSPPVVFQCKQAAL